VAVSIPSFVAPRRFQCFDESLSLSVQVSRLFIVCGCPAIRGVSRGHCFDDFGSSEFGSFGASFCRDGAAWLACRICGHSLPQLCEGGLK
jgi:hypothetical protein